MRRETAAERAAWTEAITGEKQPQPSKYRNKRQGRYASQHEAEVAGNLRALESLGRITNLREQVDVVLVEGRDGVSGVTWRADFVFDEDGETQWCDAKGWDSRKKKWITTPEFRIKERLAFLLKGITIRKL